MNMGIQNMEIHSDWFYHRLKEEDFDKIILSGGLYSKRKLGKKENKNLSSNGRDFISLSKRIAIKEGTHISDYSYPYYIDWHFGYVIEGVDAIKTRYIKSYQPLHTFLKKLPINRRYSFFYDEYQVRDEIPLEKIVGIKIPNLSSDFLDLIHSEETLEYLLEKMELTGYSFSFIDIENKKRIEPNKIKQYMKRRG